MLLQVEGIPRLEVVEDVPHLFLKHTIGKAPGTVAGVDGLAPQGEKLPGGFLHKLRRADQAGGAAQVKPPTIYRMGWPGNCSMADRAMLTMPLWLQELTMVRPLSPVSTKNSSWEKSSGTIAPSRSWQRVLSLQVKWGSIRLAEQR